MTTAISRRTPPRRLINFMNPAVHAVLRSPLHAALDRSMLVLHVIGRKTGRRYDIPVGYVDLDGHLLVVTQRIWRANLRGGADIEVTYSGRRQTMHADLDEYPTPVAATLHRAIERIGWQGAQRHLGLRIHVGRMPSRAELEAAARQYHMAALMLTAR
jgi:hypothetical protein